jgi:hypothetical protein
MKNIHLIPTDKPSRLFLKENTLLLNNQYTLQKIFTKGKCQNIYITSDEEIKEGDWYITSDNKVLKCTHLYMSLVYSLNDYGRNRNSCQKIILTTNSELIKDGVQPIDDTFLEWFVNNPSCEEVKVELHEVSFVITDNIYKIIIPQEEPKQEEDEIIDISDHDGIGNAVDNLNNEPPQETLEEASERLSKDAYKKHSVKDNNLSLDEQIQRSGGFIVGFKEGMNEGAKWQQERMYSEEDMLRFGAFMQQRHTGVKESFEEFKKK